MHFGKRWELMSRLARLAVSEPTRLRDIQLLDTEHKSGEVQKFYLALSEPGVHSIGGRRDRVLK
jgi:hypothetical protein